MKPRSLKMSDEEWQNAKILAALTESKASRGPTPGEDAWRVFFRRIAKGEIPILPLQLKWYYYTSRSFNDRVMFLERTEEIERVGTQSEAKIEFNLIIAALKFLGIPHEISAEDSFNGDVVLYGDENELREL